jgi:hypothetical protein
VGAVSETVSASLCTADWGRWCSKRQDSDDFFKNRKEIQKKIANGPKFRAYVCVWSSVAARRSSALEGGAHEMAILAKRVRTLGRGGMPAEQV